MKPLGDQTASRFIVSTDPDEHVEKIKRYLDLGFNHLVFHAPGPDQEKFLRLYGAEILPRLRTRAGPSGHSPSGTFTLLAGILMTDQLTTCPSPSRSKDWAGDWPLAHYLLGHNIGGNDGSAAPPAKRH